MAFDPDAGQPVAQRFDPDAGQHAASEGMTLSQIQQLRAQGINPSAASETTEAGEESPILGPAGGQSVAGMRLLPSGQTEQQGALELAAQLPRMATGAIAAGVPALGAAAGSMINSAAGGALGVHSAVPWYESLWNTGRDAWKQGYEGRGEGFMGVVTDPMNVVAMVAPPLAETRIVGQLAAAAGDAMRASRIPLSSKVASAAVPFAARAFEGAGYGALPGFIRGDISGSDVGKAGLIGAAINATVPAVASHVSLDNFPGIERLSDFSQGFAGRQKTGMTNIKLDKQDVLDLMDAAGMPTRGGLYKAAAKKLENAGQQFEGAFEAVAPEHRAVAMDQLRGIPERLQREVEDRAYAGIIPGDINELRDVARAKSAGLLDALGNIQAMRGRPLESFTPESQWAVKGLQAYDSPTSALFAESGVPYASLREIQALRKQYQGHYGPGSTETAKKQIDELVNDALNEQLMAAPGYSEALGGAANEYRKALQMGRLLNYNQIGAKNRYFLPVAARKLGTPGGLSGLPFAAMRNFLPVHLSEKDSAQ